MAHGARGPPGTALLQSSRVEKRAMSDISLEEIPQQPVHVEQIASGRYRGFRGFAKCGFPWTTGTNMENSTQRDIITYSSTEHFDFDQYDFTENDRIEIAKNHVFLSNKKPFGIGLKAGDRRTDLRPSMRRLGTRFIPPTPPDPLNGESCWPIAITRSMTLDSIPGLR